MDLMKQEQSERTFNKASDKELEVLEPIVEPKRTVYTYDYILNKLQELQSQMDFFNNLKVEADKLNLKR